MFRQVLTRAAIVLTLGWSGCAWWFAYLTAPCASTLQLAWNDPWVPPPTDMVTNRDLLGGALKAAHSAGDVEAARLIAQSFKACHGDATPPAPPGFVLDTPACARMLADEQLLAFLERIERSAAEVRRSEAQGQMATFALVAGAFWLVPIAAVWSLVWIFAPLSHGRAQVRP